MARYCKNGHKVDDQMNFCPQCGAEVTDKQFCKKCGHERVGDEQFCSNCGMPYKTEGLSVINNKVLGRSGAFFKKIPRSLIIGLLALFIVGGGLFYWFFIRTDYSFEGLAKTLAENDIQGAGVFSEGLVMVSNDDWKIGYMDKKGNLIVPCKYDMEEDAHYSTTSEGLTKVIKDGKYGFIDKKGEEVIPCKYDWAEDFSEGLAAVRQDEDWRFIDKTGKVFLDLSDKQYGGVGNFKEGLASVCNDEENWGFIDKTGKEVIPCIYGHVYSFSEGLATVYKDGGNWGFIDKTGKEVIPCKYGWANSFSEGLAVICQDEKYGVIDKNGKEVVPCQYENIGDFSEGLAIVYSDWKIGYMDRNGKIVIPCIYDAEEDGEIDGSFSNGLALVSRDGQYGFINKQGKEVIPLGKYDSAECFSEGLAAVSKDGIWGFINTKGESTFDHISESQLTAMKERQEKKREEEQRKWEEENNPAKIFYRTASQNTYAWLCNRNGWYGGVPCLFFYPSGERAGAVSFVVFSDYQFNECIYYNGASGKGTYTISDNFITCDIVRRNLFTDKVSTLHLMFEIINEGEGVTLSLIGENIEVLYQQISRPRWDPFHEQK